MKKLRIEPEAEADLQEIQDWYESRVHGLGERFSAVMFELLRQIGTSPEMFREVEPGVRWAMAEPFPYKVYYTLGRAEIRVFYVVHAGRHPRRWQTRRDNSDG